MEASPQPGRQLDISRVMIPFSLIVCKSTLARMSAGAVLEIRLQDPETLQDLLMILNRSGDQILAWEQQNDDYCLWVRKKT
ncbi:MAG: sulfurtransferase TusA family protein [Thermodesulfobacteriota bacterium]